MFIAIVTRVQSRALKEPTPLKKIIPQQKIGKTLCTCRTGMWHRCHAVCAVMMNIADYVFAALANSLNWELAGLAA